MSSSSEGLCLPQNSWLWLSKVSFFLELPGPKWESSSSDQLEVLSFSSWASNRPTPVVDISPGRVSGFVFISLSSLK